jgi:integrase
MPNLKLTDPFIRNHPAPESRIEIYDTHSQGLAIRITANGHKSFVYRYRFNDRVRRFTIGTFPNIGLADARDEVSELSYKVNHGTDPLAEKKKRKYQPKEKTFEQLAVKFQQRQLPTLRESSQKEYNRIIDNELVPEFKGMNVSDITKHHVRNFLDDKAYGTKKQKAAPTIANRIRAVLSSMFSFGIKKMGLTIERNPVQDTPTYKAGKNKRDRFYSEDEIKVIWNAFEYEAEPVQPVFKMLLLTAQRKTETMNMKWDDVQNTIWTIPAENAKNKQSHEVPLSDTALQIIEAMRPLTGQSDYVFESPRLENEPLGWIKQAVDNIREISGVTDFRIHDLRRTAATFMAKGGTDPMIIGKVLNHKGLAQENQITAIYNRHDYLAKKKQALNRWSHKLQQIISGTEAKIHKMA